MLVIEAATSAAATAHCGGGGDDRCGDKGLTAAATLATAARRCSDNLCMRSAQGRTLHSKVFISFTGKVFISQAKFSFHTTHSRPHSPGTDRGIGPANLRHTAQESACEHAGSCSTACR